MKYVMLAQQLSGQGLTQFVPIIFPKQLVHAEVAKAILPLLNKATTVSAGEVNFLADGTVHCYGYSKTLGLGPRPDDALVISAIDYSWGFIG